MRAATPLAALALLLAGCATVPAGTVRESLDERTGTTVTWIEEPVELVAVAARAPGSDPFAFVGAFETNRMGTRAIFLWVAVPNEVRGRVDIALTLDADVPLPLGEAIPDPKALSLATLPYTAPASWSAIHVYPLSEASLALLAVARRIEVAARYADGGARVRFAGEVVPADAFAKFRESLGLP